ISHPLAVAHILTQLKMDAMTIASALLHDTIEDTGVTSQQVTERFANGVAMPKHIRVLLVKLAARLHNLRTLEYMPEPKQRAIAQETLDIYAPLAHRLGIAWMKAELEDLSFRYINPRAYSELAGKIAHEQAAQEQ